jgi:cytidine deaminase
MVRDQLVEAFDRRRKSLVGVEIDPYEDFVRKRPGLKDDLELVSSLTAFPAFPASDTNVGCVAVSDDQRFTGSNIRRKAYNDTSCAERVTIDKLVSTLRHTAQLDRIIIHGESGNEELQGFVNPCGSCRGIILETLHSLEQDDVNIIMLSNDRKQVASTFISQLLPMIR